MGLMNADFNVISSSILHVNVAFFDVRCFTYDLTLSHAGFVGVLSLGTFCGCLFSQRTTLILTVKLSFMPDLLN